MRIITNQYKRISATKEQNNNPRKTSHLKFLLRYCTFLITTSIARYYTEYYTKSMKTYPMCVFSSNETEIIKHCISIVSQFFCRSRLVKTAGPIIIFDRHFNRQIFSSKLTVFQDLQFGKVSFSLPVHPKMLT